MIGGDLVSCVYGFAWGIIFAEILSKPALDVPVYAGTDRPIVQEVQKYLWESEGIRSRLSPVVTQSGDAYLLMVSLPNAARGRELADRFI